MPPAATPRSGLLLVGHGTRSTAGRAEFLQTAEMVAATLSGVPVEPCFLELAEPTIAAGLARLAEQDVKQVIVAPLLLFAAGHAKRDIPAAVSSAALAYPRIHLVQTPHFGCDDELLELSAERFREVAGEPTADFALVMVGRGSLDAEATAEMRRFTDLRAKRTPAGLAATCFVAMAEPRLEQLLEQVVEQGWRHIVVQPHLLFQGDLLDGIRATFSAALERWPDRDWRLAAHLGPAPQVVAAIVRRYRLPRS